jgi:Lrp/AsnC family transcriptional regulator, leucine-responsive regulatory protein
MDEKDKLLLAELSRNARQPMIALARRIGLSRSATQERLAKLETTGAITGYTLAGASSSPPEQIAHMFLHLRDGMTCAKIGLRIKAIPGVAAVYSVAGDIDLIIRLEAISMNNIEAARAAVAALPGLSVSRTILTLRVL